jgi:carbon-monoxide dehydrogenase medium subunit
MGSTPIFAAKASAAWAQGASAREVADLVTAEAEPQADLNASVSHREHLARVLTRRAIEASNS